MTLSDDFLSIIFTKRTKLFVRSISIPAKLLKTLIELDFANFKKKLPN